MKKQSGFTLIELMVVMAIIAILATAGLSAYTSYIKEARDTTRLQIAKQLGIKVEQLSNISGAPTADQLEAFLTAENFGYKLPELHPVIAKIADSMDGILGVAFALPDIDPLKGKPVCLDENNNPRIVCGFSYFQFSDGTYAIGYTVEKENNKVNFLFDPALSRANATDTYASFIGNSPIVTLVNGGNSSAGTGVSIVAALTTVNTTFNIGSPISITSAKIVSEKNGHTNAASQPSSTISPSSTDPTTTTSAPTTINCSSVGQVCSDGTVYVSSTLRTTPSNEISMTQSNAVTFCQNKGAGWRLPNISELKSMCNNSILIGNLPINDPYGYNSSNTIDTSIWVSGWNNNCGQGTGGNGVSRRNRCVKDV